MTEPQIRIVEDGPYEVVGPLPLARTSKVKTEYGEPVDYTPLEPIETDTNYRLCRCGKSANKPFCDDSELEEPRVDVKERPPSKFRHQTIPCRSVLCSEPVP